MTVVCAMFSILTLFFSLSLDAIAAPETLMLSGRLVSSNPSIAISRAELIGPNRRAIVLELDRTQSPPAYNASVQAGVAYTLLVRLDGQQPRSLSIPGFESAGSTVDFTIDVDLMAEVDASVLEYLLPDLRAETGPDFHRLGANDYELRLNMVFFEFDSDQLSLGYEEALDRLAEVIVGYPGLELEISGHADDLGEDIYNMNLSARRTDNVAEFLRQRYPQLKPITRYRGELEPLVAFHHSEQRKYNRRVELILRSKVAGKE